MTEAEYQREWLAENFECEGLLNFVRGAKAERPLFTEEELKAVLTKIWSEKAESCQPY